LQRYLKNGGFSGVYDIPEELRADLLRTYWDTMLLRDVIEAHNDEKTVKHDGMEITVIPAWKWLLES